MKIIALTLVLFVLLTVFVSAFEHPKNAIRISDSLYDLGEANVKGEKLHGFMYVHRELKSSQKTSGARLPACYSLMGPRWRITEPYVLNTANSRGLDDAFVSSVISTSMNSWDQRVSFQIFGPRDFFAVVDGSDSSAPDGKNEIYFGSISEPGVIAVTTVWGTFYGPKSSKKIVEFDMVFDQADFDWGNNQSGKMDLQNIATHELGHAAGMDHPPNSCAEETMFAYASEGETKKRSLNSGDITGIVKLYS